MSTQPPVEPRLEQHLQSRFAALQLPLDGQALVRYRTYFNYLEEMNQVMNLTAISGETDVAQLHFLDCAVIAAQLPLNGRRVIDVGTGAGFPGLALKIVCPEMELTLLDSLDKRINFLKSCCTRLDFSDVTCLHARAEEAPAQMRESYDLALSRAVARLNLLCELCLPCVKVNGYFVAMKGPDCSDEVKEAEKGISHLGGKVEAVRDYTVPGTDVVHSLVLIRKVRPTPSKYPRRWAQIKKTPL